MGFFSSFANAAGINYTPSDKTNSDERRKSKIDPLTLVKKYIGTAKFYLTSARREYAYYKNEKFGDPQEHYLKARSFYQKALDIAEKAQQTMDENQIYDSSLTVQINEIITECNQNK